MKYTLASWVGAMNYYHISSFTLCSILALLWISALLVARAGPCTGILQARHMPAGSVLLRPASYSA